MDGFAQVRERVADAIGGVAIAVALMPPLCVVGIGAALRDWHLDYGALLLFATNLFGITLACGVVFALAGLATARTGAGLLTAALGALLVAVPLAGQTTRLVIESRVESSLRDALLNDTATFRRVKLLGVTIDWLTQPLDVTLLVRAAEAITPGQALDLQRFASRRVGRPLHLTIDEMPVEHVAPPPQTASPAPA